MKTFEKDIFLLLTTACNLQCFSCGYGCSKNEEPWFITEEEFKNILLKLKNTHIDNCFKYSINLTGGDPLMHPQWEQFALLTKEIFPTQVCFVSTNGLLLNKISDEKLLYLCNNKDIRFGVSLYPSTKLLKIYKEIELRFTKLNIKDHLTWNASHLMFGKSIINNFSEFNYHECYDNMINNCDCVHIYKNKLFNCQHSFLTDRYLNNTEAYHINNIKPYDNLKLIEIGKNNCKTCKIFLREKTLWQPQSKLKTNCTLIPLKDLYINNYKDYYTLCHDCKEHLECLKDDLFSQHFTPHPFKNAYNIITNRFFNGALDVYIPFSELISINFKNLLLKQSIFDKCNFYFIDLSKNKEIQEKNYILFEDLENTFFLKADNLLNGLHIFLQNSYLSSKICLDHSTNQLIDNQFLEKLLKD